MKPKILEALSVAAEEIEQHARIEEAEDRDLAEALRMVSDMLHHLSERASSPLFADLKRQITESGGDGNVRELKQITVTMAAFLMAYCGNGQNEAIQNAIDECGYSSRSSLQRALAGARDAETVKKIADWPSISERIEGTKVLARYQTFGRPELKEVDWRTSVIAILVDEAKKIREGVAQVSV